MIKTIVLASMFVTPALTQLTTDSNEKVSFTSGGPIHVERKTIVSSKHQIALASKSKKNTKVSKTSKADIERYVHNASIKYGVDEKLVHAVIKTESTYRTKAVSNKGAVGLMQLMPATAARFGVNDRNDAQQNIEGGVRFLKFLLDTFHDNKLAVAGYNSGEHAVMRHNNQIPPYPETQNYVKLVMSAYQG
jgi:soluble lytic murein transglycosylase-like protein